jgi:DNA-binding GntR family transcriptional regulator
LRNNVQIACQDTGSSVGAEMKKGMEYAHSTLRNRIVAGVYEAGTQMKEEHLAEEFGMSRTPIRAALKRLADEGLVVVEAHRGVFVAGWTKWDIEEMFSLRAILEPHAARLAAQRATPEDISHLQDINADMAIAIQGKGEAAVQGVQVANRAFHTALLDCAKSQRLKSMLLTLIDMPVITRSFVLYSAPDFQRSLQQHQDIVYAVEHRDADLAATLMEAHIRIAYSRFMSHRLDMPSPAHAEQN